MINFGKSPFLKRYVPVASQMLCLIEQADCLNKRKEDERKADVLRRVVIGNSLNQIAADMHISRQRVYELELSALARLHDEHSTLVSRFDRFRRAEFSSKVARMRVLDRISRNKQKPEVKAKLTNSIKEDYRKRRKTILKDSKARYKENKNEIMKEYHQNPKNIARRMMKDLKSIRIHIGHILKRIEKTESHIKRHLS